MNKFVIFVSSALLVLFRIASAKVILYPYLMPGIHSGLDKESVSIFWLTDEDDIDAKTEFRTDDSKTSTLASISKKNVQIDGKSYYLFQALLDNLGFDENYYYTVTTRYGIIRQQTFRTRTKSNSFKFVVWGCSGEDTRPQIQIAKQIESLNANCIIHLGDFSYPKIGSGDANGGKLEDVIKRGIKPIDGEVESDNRSVLLSKCLTYLVYGNKEVNDGRGFNQGLNSLATFWLTNHPVNGPLVPKNYPNKLSQSDYTIFQNLVGRDKDGDLFERKTNYSFDVGNIHFTVIDGNVWQNPDDSNLRSWIRQDITNSRATWKIVVMHQPPFSPFISLAKDAKSIFSTSTFDSLIEDEGRSRRYVPLFEECGVDIVFTAHVHAYERVQPIKGVEYISSGAGGAHLHMNLITDQKGRVFSLMAEAALRGMRSLIGSNYNRYSYTIVNVIDRVIELEQYDSSGVLIDSHRIEKK